MCDNRNNIHKNAGIIISPSLCRVSMKDQRDRNAHTWPLCRYTYYAYIKAVSPSLWLPISCLINPCRRLFYTPFSQCHRRLTLRGQKRLPFFFSLLLLRLDLAYCLTTMPPLCYVCVNSSHFFKRLKACERITQTAFSAETPIFREVLCSSKFVSSFFKLSPSLLTRKVTPYCIVICPPLLFLRLKRLLSPVNLMYEPIASLTQFSLREPHTLALTRLLYVMVAAALFIFDNATSELLLCCSIS